MNKTKQLLKYLIADFIAAAIAWALFYAYRKLHIESEKFGYTIPLHIDKKFYFK